MQNYSCLNRMWQVQQIVYEQFAKIFACNKYCYIDYGDNTSCTKPFFYEKKIQIKMLCKIVLTKIVVKNIFT